MLICCCSQFCSSSGSVVVLYGSRLSVKGDQSFLSNRATVGGAISLYDESSITAQLSQVRATGWKSRRPGEKVYFHLDQSH